MTEISRMSLNQLLGKYKTLKHMRTAYINAGKVMTDLQYISWTMLKAL